MSYIDPATGELTYDAGDARGPMHSVLNQGQNASRVARLSDRQRLDALEARFAAMDQSTPWANVPINSTYFNYGNIENLVGNTPSLLQYRKLGSVVQLAGVANAFANAPNFSVLGTLPVGMRPGRPEPFLYLLGNGPNAYRGLVLTNGNILLSFGAASGTNFSVMPTTLYLN